MIKTRGMQLASPDLSKLEMRQGTRATDLGRGNFEVELAGEDAFLPQGLHGRGRGRGRRGGGGGHPPPRGEGPCGVGVLGEEPNGRGARPAPSAGESGRGSGARVTWWNRRTAVAVPGSPSICSMFGWAETGLAGPAAGNQRPQSTVH